MYGCMLSKTNRPLDVLRIGGTEQKGLPLLFGGHARGAHQLPHVWLKPHVQHSVCLIQHQVFQLAEANLVRLDSYAHLLHSTILAEFFLPKCIIVLCFKLKCQCGSIHFLYQ